MLMSSDEAALVRYQVYLVWFVIESVLWRLNVKGHKLPSDITLIFLVFQSVLLSNYTRILCGRSNNLDAASYTFKWLHYSIVIIGLTFFYVQAESQITSKTSLLDSFVSFLIESMSSKKAESVSDLPRRNHWRHEPPVFHEKVATFRIEACHD